MRVRVKTYIGNGEERIEFEGQAARIDLDGVVNPQIFLNDPVTVAFFASENPEFDVVKWEPHGIGILKFVKRRSSRFGEREVFITTAFGTELTRKE